MTGPGALVGQYLPGESAVHRLDPRTKILLLLGHVALVFAAPGWWSQAALAAWTAAVVLAARLPGAALWRGLRPIVGLVVFTVLLNAWLTPGPVAIRLGPVALTQPGLEFGARMGVRLLLLVVASLLLTATTSPVALADGLESLLRPLQPVGVPAHELALMTTIALRFVPTLADEAQRIARAQAARGADFASRSAVRRLQLAVPLLVPLLFGALRRADELALAMEARCYRGGLGRTRMRERRLGWLDAVAWVVWLGLAGAVLGLRGRG